MAKSNLAGGLSVTDEEAKAAVRFAFRELKLVVEPGGAVSLAAILAKKLPFEGKTVAAVLSGGNIDPSAVCRHHRRQARGMMRAGCAARAPQFRRARIGAVCRDLRRRRHQPPVSARVARLEGLGPREIAIITATPLFIRVLVTPAIAFAADRAGDHRRFLIVLSWCGLAALARAVAVVGLLADPDLHRGLRPGLDHDHAADRDGGAERRQSGGARLWPHAPVGIAQLHRRQPRWRLGRGALRRGIGHLAGGGRRRAHDGGRAHACPADRARPPEGGDQPAAPAHIRRCWACCARACF